jgi:hypothetical protein
LLAAARDRPMRSLAAEKLPVSTTLMNTLIRVSLSMAAIVS